MPDDHRAFRLPGRLWHEDYVAVVGNRGRTGDLKSFMDWQIDNPGARLGEDFPGEYDYNATIRVEPERWDLFVAAAGTNYSSRLRAYILWRTINPDAPLPGRRTPPLRRQRTVACV